MSDEALRVAIGRKNVPDLDGAAGCSECFELKSIVSATPGRDVSEFGTVRPRVQIPGPRPSCLLDLGNILWTGASAPPNMWGAIIGGAR